VEPHPARLEPDPPRPEPELRPVEAARAPSLGAILLESKEMVFLLVGIVLAFLIHFGFGDFVKTESSTPKVRNAVSVNEVGSSERVRAESFERAAERAARRRQAAQRARTRRAAAARAAAARSAAASAAARSSTSGTSSAPSTRSTPAVSSPAPAPRTAPKPRSSPARSGGGGGGQSFDDSG
jgi:hypothetical protein